MKNPLPKTLVFLRNNMALKYLVLWWPFDDIDENLHSSSEFYIQAAHLMQDLVLKGDRMQSLELRFSFTSWSATYEERRVTFVMLLASYVKSATKQANDVDSMSKIP